MRTDTSVLSLFAVVELLATTFLVLLLVGVSAVRARGQARRTAQRDEWLAALTPTLEEAGPPGEEVRLRGMRRHQRVTTVSGIVAQLSGEAAHRVVAASDEPEVVRAAQEWCRSRLWWRRLRGVRTLIMMGGEQPDLLALLDDPHPQVRAEATNYVAANHDPGGIDRLITMLDDDAAWCQFAAEDSLLRIGARAVDPLISYLERPSAQEPLRALRVATGIASSAFLPTALDRCRDPRADVRVAAAELVSAIGGESAAAALLELLSDAEPTVRAAAANRLGVLAHWPAAPLLTGRLADPDWNVRRAAAGALWALGTPGRFYLRRALHSPDRFVSDMAQHTLDLPDIAHEARPQ
jgi:HEAT repeat protein